VIPEVFKLKKVIIVEDDIELRDSLADYLGTCGNDVTGVGSAIELYQMIAQTTYDVAVVDVNLPHYDGFSIAAYLAEKTSSAIILITVRGTVDDRVHGYNSGADLYMVKPVDCEELAAAIDALARKRRRQRDGVREISAKGWCLDRTQFSLLAPSGGSVILTRKELQFLEVLAARPGAIVTRLDMLVRLGYDIADAESRALDVAISRLRGKVQAECATTLPLQTVQNAGYVFSGELTLR